jgi:cell division protein FtsL
MRNENNQKGFLTFTGILMILTVVVVIFSAFKLLPPYISNYQLQDAINNITRTATYSNANDEAVRKDVMLAAHESGVKLDPAQVRVERTRDSVDINIDYSITVDMMVKPVTLHFTPSATNRLITAK